MTDTTPQPLDLDAIQARVEAAAKAPWSAAPRRWGAVVDDAEESIVAELESLYHPERALADAVFIAHARQDVPALLAEVEALRTERDRLRTVALEAVQMLRDDAVAIDGEWGACRNVQQIRADAADCGWPQVDLSDRLAAALPDRRS